MTHAARKRTAYEKQLASLNEEWQAVLDQIRWELNPANKVKLQRQADDLDQQIVALEVQLQQLDAPQKTDDPSSTSGDGRSPTTQYNITITGGQGITIGDQAQVTQQFANSGSDAPPSAPPPVDTERLVALADQITRYFNLSEVRDLCFRLGIEYEDLGGEGKSEKVRELVMRVERNGRLPHLIPLLQQLRPHVDWK